MKFFSILFLLFLGFNAFAQKADEVLATVGSQKITVENLAPEAREMWKNLPKTVAETRTELLAQQVADILLKDEAATRKMTVEKLIETEISGKIANPTEAQIQAVYDANRAAIGDKTLAEVRPQIVAFLRREPSQKALMDYVSQLKTKYKPVFGKDVNAPNLKPADVLATVNGKIVTLKNFEDKNRQTVYELEAEAFEHTEAALREAVLNEVINLEAKSQNIAASDLIAREITDKMRDYSDEERHTLINALQKRLFAKHNVKFLIKEPQPFAQSISVDDDPTIGSANTRVTIVMFTDFQCPACAATHPVLKQVLEEYKGKVRFVVRDFPLVNIHENAFLAAQAANAANAQGKFFEYAEILYKNQTALDRASLKKYAAELGLDQARFDADLDGEKFPAEIRKDMADGASYGITGTPTIFVNGVKVRTLSAASFRNAIEKALKK